MVSPDIQIFADIQIFPDQLPVEDPRLIRRSLDLLLAQGVLRASDLETRLGMYLEEIESISGLRGYFETKQPAPQSPRIISFDQKPVRRTSE